MTRPFHWSVRRELWENRSLYYAPLATAVFLLFGYGVSTIGMPERRRALLTLDAAKQSAAISMPYDVAAIMLIVTAFLVGAFYCLDALYGERRDRSILFWKSLPVSDRTTVLAKAAIPLAVLPIVTFVITVITQLLMLLWTTVVLLPSGLAGSTFRRYNFLEQSVILLYGLIVVALWHAPIYGWLLLISAWARRAAVLWGVLPLFAIAIFEKLAFGSMNFALMIRHRVFDFVSTAFVFDSKSKIDSVTQLAPGRFLSTPSLWMGLIFAAICLVAAVRLRRNREPI
ncbi:MAG TPA: ABC transporter permease [Thermoanaerobaculia bacterium]|nr:ABC transporter permease [Thermoanaerobaculia bacterium]